MCAPCIFVLHGVNDVDVPHVVTGTLGMLLYALRPCLHQQQHNQMKMKTVCPFVRIKSVCVQAASSTQ